MSATTLGIESVVHPGARVGERPVLSDKLVVTSKQRRGCDDEGSPALTRKQLRECREEGAVGGGEAWSCHLAADHGDLMTKHRDLDVLLVRRRTGTEEKEKLANQQKAIGEPIGGSSQIYITPVQVPNPVAPFRAVLSQGTTYLLDGYWSEVYPARLVVMLTVVVFDFVGDALRDTLDARLRDR